MRALESAVSSSQTLNTYRGWTHKFIFPPHEFSIADSMVTNFHLPKSTLLMMVSAFAGHDFMKKAYQEAVKKKYRFYSYGDAMLIL
jgi:S-adenosylmethionine:tRNA ribosyltransferase-isomerase